jgi:HEAT repeat protein
MRKGGLAACVLSLLLLTACGSGQEPAAVEVAPPAPKPAVQGQKAFDPAMDKFLASSPNKDAAPPSAEAPSGLPDPGEKVAADLKVLQKDVIQPEQWKAPEVPGAPVKYSPVPGPEQPVAAGPQGTKDKKPTVQVPVTKDKTPGKPEPGRTGPVQDPKKEPKKDEEPKGKTPEDYASELSTLGGRTIDEWVRDIASKDPSKVENALRTVILFPPSLSHRAVPEIVKVLNRNPTALFLTDFSTRVNGAYALGVILAEDNKPKPDKEQVKQGIYTLTNMLERDPQILSKYRAAQALAKIGPAARTESTITALLKMLRDRGNWEMRSVAAMTLGRVAQDKDKGPPNMVLNALYDLVKNDNAAQVRLSAIHALAIVGAPPKEYERKAYRKALEAVSKEDPDPTVQIWAHMVVMNIDGKVQPDRVKAIAGMLTNDDLGARLEAARAIGSMGNLADTEVPALVKALDDREKSVAYLSMLALAQMGNKGEPAVMRLQQIQKDEKWPPELRRLAEVTVDVIRGKFKKKDENGKSNSKDKTK